MMSTRRFALLCCLLVLITLFTSVTADSNDLGAPVSQFVFGVYTSWETTYIPSYTDTAANRAGNLTSFFTKTFFPVLTANNSFNLVWTTDGPENPSGEVSEFTAAAQQAGVLVVNGSDGDFYLNASQNSEAFITSGVDILKALWNGANPRPLAFCVSDEPHQPDAIQLASYVTQAVAAGVPVTAVLSASTAESFGATMRQLPWVAFDRYPFFSDPTSGPTGNSSYDYFLTMEDDFGTAHKHGNPQVWVIAQACQGVEGHYQVNSDGTVTVLAGSGLEWVMPTPAQVSWEAWASAAMGAKGVIFFVYSQIPEWVATVKKPPRAGSSWAYAENYDTQSYPGLVSFPGYNAGPQLLYLQSQTIPDIRSVENILLKSHTLINSLPNPEPVNFSGTLMAGDYINFLGAPGGVTYVVIVSSPERTQGSISLSLSQNVKSLAPMGNAPAIHVAGQTATLALPAGGGAVYQVMEE